MQITILITLCAAVVLVSPLAAPRGVTVDGLYGGRFVAGEAPGLWALTLSQVTTWVFAHSLTNAASLGYYYGFAGTMTYAAYYGSFLTGGYIIRHLRA